MASRIRALRRGATEVGEELSERAQRMMGRTPPTDYTTFALIAVSGFALGLMVGLLFAPSSGYETRHMIGDRASTAYESAREMAKRRAEELGERVEEIA